MGTDERSPFGKLLRDGRITAEVSQQPICERGKPATAGINHLGNAARTAPRHDTVRLLADDLDLVGPDRAAHSETRWQRIPVPPTPLVGREREVKAVMDLLCDDDVRLVTLTGPGGVGKTRLAVAVAHHLIDYFTDGVVFIDLSPVRDLTLVLPTLAAAFGVHESRGQGLDEVVATVLRDRHVLLIFDNCEQVVDAAPDIATVVSSCPALKVLATSRVALRLTAEHVLPVPTLQLPDPASLSSLSELAQSEAVAMFVDRARAVDPAFNLTDTNAETIATLVRRLDGLPLAIALAAARIRTLPPRALLARIEYRLDVLTDGPRDAPARLRDMRDAIAWSYDLLTGQEQMLFRRLAVFVGGFTLEAAGIVAGDGRDVMKEVSTLVAHSLLTPAAGMDEEFFTMLETIRAYALEQLASSGELQDIQQLHASWCLTLVEAVEAEHIGPGRPSATDRLGANRDNIRAALQWLREHDEIDTGLRLASALWPLWLERGEISEGRSHLTGYLSEPQAPAIQGTWARAMSVSGALAQAQGDHQQAVHLSQQALEVFSRSGDLRGAAVALNTLGIDAMCQGDLAESEQFLQESLACFRAVGDPRAGGWAMRHLSSLAYRRGDIERAAAWARDGLSFLDQRANRLYTARLLLNVSLLSVLQLNLERAEALSQEALVLFREERDRWGEAYALIRLGRVAHERRDLVRASTYLAASLSLLRDIGDLEGISVVLTLLGWVSRSQDSRTVAASHFAEGLALSRERHHPCGASEALLGEGALAMDRNDGVAAAAAWDESLHLASQSEDPLAIATIIEWIARLTATGNHGAGVRLYGAASTFREAQGIPETASSRDDRARFIEGMRSVLGSTAFAEAFATGRNMSKRMAIAGAKDILARVLSDSQKLSRNPSAALLPEGAGSGAPAPMGLTHREREVLQLISEGRSNREIAQVLFISPRTAAVHIDHILTKLGLGSRAAAAAFAVRHGLA